jgi:peptidoglycan hydrolase-like protein with peptidoglycan-binding domain
MKQIRLRRHIAAILTIAKQQGEKGLTVGQVKDRLIDRGYKNIPSGRRLGQVMRVTPGFIMKDRRYIYDTARGGSVQLCLWSINELEVSNWL